MAAKIVLIRHGDTGQQFRERFIGSTDVSLSPDGRRQSSLLREPLRKAAVIRYIMSPALRTRETAREALAGKAIVPELDPDLREINFGAWEGKTFYEIQAADPEAVNRWAAYEPDFSFPAGESIAAFMKRVGTAGVRIAVDPADTVAVFTHAGVIRALICHYLALESKNSLYFDVKPASLTTILVDNGNGRGVLAGLNDRCHLEDARE